MSKRYCAVIGDIRKSRSLPRRAAVQRKFAKAIETINAEFKPAIASRFLVTLGDEFQGLLTSPAESYSLVQRFQDLMDPVPFSYGVGLGTLSTPLQPSALGMDGEAFHRARSALSSAKKSKRQLVYDFDHPALGLVNALLGLMEQEWARLTPRQRQIARLLKQLDNQEDVARRLRITQPAVSKASSRFSRIAEAESALRSFLDSL